MNKREARFAAAVDKGICEGAYEILNKIYEKPNTEAKKKYYKFITANRSSHEFNYKMGINEITEEQLKENPYFGLYLTDIKHIFAYLNYGPILCEVEIPEDATVVEDDESMWICGPIIPGYRANKINVISMLPLSASLVAHLISEGADISVDDYNLFSYALYHNKEIWDYLSNRYPKEIEKFLSERRD